MKGLTRLTVILTFLILSGCASKYPFTAQEFREAAPEAFFGKLETFEVNRPYEDVAETFQTMAPKCLNVRIRASSNAGTILVTRYHPTVIRQKDKTELHIQELFESGAPVYWDEPEMGHYIMVTDAIRENSNTTKIMMYRPSIGKKVMINALRGWATGENVGCPDLTK